MTVLVFAVGACAVISAMGVVLFQEAIYSALSLIANIISLAIFFLVLNAQFLFAVQIIIYAGAVMVLFVFIIALFGSKKENRPPMDYRFIVGILGVVVLTGFVVLLTTNNISYNPSSGLHGFSIGHLSNPYNTFSFTENAVNIAGNIQAVGGQLFTVFLLPFEITSLLLLVAVIGAVYFTRRVPEEGKKQ